MFKKVKRGELPCLNEGKVEIRKYHICMTEEAHVLLTMVKMEAQYLNVISTNY